MSDKRLAIRCTLSCSGWESVFADHRCAGVGKGRFPHPSVRIVPQETRFPWEKPCCGLCHQGLWHRVGDGLVLVVPGADGTIRCPRGPSQGRDAGGATQGHGIWSFRGYREKLGNFEQGSSKGVGNCKEFYVFIMV